MYPQTIKGNTSQKSMHFSGISDHLIYKNVNYAWVILVLVTFLWLWVKPFCRAPKILNAGKNLHFKTWNIVVFSFNMSSICSMLSQNILLVVYGTIASDLMWWRNEIISILYVLDINMSFITAVRCWKGWKCTLKMLEKCLNPDWYIQL